MSLRARWRLAFSRYVAVEYVTTPAIRPMMTTTIMISMREKPGEWERRRGGERRSDEATKRRRGGERRSDEATKRRRAKCGAVFPFVASSLRGSVALLLLYRISRPH